MNRSYFYQFICNPLRNRVISKVIPLLPVIMICFQLSPALCADFRGNWSGTWIDSQGLLAPLYCRDSYHCGNLSVNLTTQDVNGNLGGTITVENTSCGTATFPVATGSYVSGNTAYFQGYYSCTCYNCESLAFTSGTLTNVNSMNGSWVLNVNSNGQIKENDVGDFSLTRPASAPPTPLIGNLENPADGQTVAGITTIHGWAIDGKGITKVEWFIDGSQSLENITYGNIPLGNIPYGSSRMDVKNAYPTYPNAENSGFGGIWNWSLLSAGNHAIKVRLHNQDGQTKDLNATVTVKKFQGDFVTNVNPGTWTLPNCAVTGGGITKNYGIEIQWSNATQGYQIIDVIPK